jgi:hypothetical protein
MPVRANYFMSEAVVTGRHPLNEILFLDKIYRSSRSCLICLCHTSFESCTVDDGESIPTSPNELSEILCKDIDIV